VTVNPTATTTYTVTGTSANGCVNTASVTITALPRPNVTAASSASTICSGDTVTLTSAGASTYTWLPGLLTGNPVAIAPQAPTTYTVTGTGSNGCNNTATVSVIVNTSPVVAVSVAQDTLCFSSAPIALNGSPAGGIFSGPGVSGAAFDPATAGFGMNMVSYNYTATNGCSGSDSAAVYVDVCTDVASAGTELLLEIIPNPNNGSFMINLEILEEDAVFTLVNQLGQIVDQFSVNAGTTTVRVEYIAAGMYVLTAQTAGKAGVKRIIVQ
jgi:hypothetical protein